MVVYRRERRLISRHTENLGQEVFGCSPKGQRAITRKDRNCDAWRQRVSANSCISRFDTRSRTGTTRNNLGRCFPRYANEMLIASRFHRCQRRVAEPNWKETIARIRTKRACISTRRSLSFPGNSGTCKRDFVFMVRARRRFRANKFSRKSSPPFHRADAPRQACPFAW